MRVIMIQCNEDSVVDDNRKEFDDESDSQVNKGKEVSLIVATLIASVTFTAGFTMPGGYISDAGPLQGAAILRKRSAFKASMISSTIAMLLSCSAVFIHIYIPMQQDKSQMISLFSTAFILTPFAMVAMVLSLGNRWVKQARTPNFTLVAGQQWYTCGKDGGGPADHKCPAHSFHMVSPYNGLMSAKSASNGQNFAQKCCSIVVAFT
ncbi:hypothetical protein TIFTF001_049457 [Ficus carica]|uniref:PGG domain-containing protein n=1 Tax=Ficus carica TaxID=3494 RepID=A0AA88D6E5_FICCA|nr:hypothetical protein TIFTF001_049457 [Ficus carica]